MRQRQTLAPQAFNQKSISLERNTISANQQYLPSSSGGSTSGTNYNNQNLNQRSISLTRPQFNSLAPTQLQHANTISASMAQASIAGMGKKANFDSKQMQQVQIDNIFSFLTSNNYDQVISIKMLQAPSSKLFFQVFQFFINMYDPFLGSVQVEDIPQLMKYIGYPHTLSKNMFIAIGAPHTWNHVLSLLNWLCNMLRYKQAAMMEEEERALTSASSPHYSLKTDTDIINEYIAESFLMGNEYNKQSAMTSVEEKLQRRREHLEQEVRDFQMKIETVMLAKKNLMNDQPDLHELDLKISQQAERIFRENELITKAESDLHQLERELESERKSLVKRCDELEGLRQQKRGFEEIIAEQDFDINEAKRFENEIQQNTQLKNKLQQHKEAKKNAISQLYQEMEVLFQETDKMVSEYNAILMQNKQQIPNSQVIMAKLNFDIFKEPLREGVRRAYNEGNFKQLKNEFIGFDMKHVAKARLQQTLFQTKVEINELKTLIADTEKEIKRFDEQLMELQNEKKQLKAGHEHLLEMLAIKTENLKEIQRTFQTNADKMHKELTSLNIDIEKGKSEEHQASNQLQIEMNDLEKVQQEQKVITKEIEEVRAKDQERVKSFKSEIVQLLKDMNEKVHAVNTKFKELYKVRSVGVDAGGGGGEGMVTGIQMGASVSMDSRNVIIGGGVGGIGGGGVDVAVNLGVKGDGDGC